MSSRCWMRGCPRGHRSNSRDDALYGPSSRHDVPPVVHDVGTALPLPRAGEGRGEGRRVRPEEPTLTPILSRERERGQLPSDADSLLAVPTHDAPSYRLRRAPLDVIARNARATVTSVTSAAPPLDPALPPTPLAAVPSARPTQRVRATAPAATRAISDSNAQLSTSAEAPAPRAVVRERRQSGAGSHAAPRQAAQADFAQADAVALMTSHPRHPATAAAATAAAPSPLSPASTAATQHPASPTVAEPAAVARRDVPVNQLVERVARVVLRRLAVDLERRGGKPWR